MDVPRCRTLCPEKTLGRAAWRPGSTARARDMNAFLLVLAIGLATLDLTCLWAFKLQDALPAMTRTSASSTAINSNGAINKPAQAKPPPKPNPTAAGSGS